MSASALRAGADSPSGAVLPCAAPRRSATLKPWRRGAAWARLRFPAAAMASLISLMDELPGGIPSCA